LKLKEEKRAFVKIGGGKVDFFPKTKKKNKEALFDFQVSETTNQQRIRPEQMGLIIIKVIIKPSKGLVGDFMAFPFLDSPSTGPHLLKKEKKKRKYWPTTRRRRWRRNRRWRWRRRRRRPSIYE
jgi:hypothetical protein